MYICTYADETICESLLNEKRWQKLVDMDLRNKFAKKCPKCSPISFFVQIYTKLLTWKMVAKQYRAFSVIKKYKNSHPKGDNSPNLVALMAREAFYFKSTVYIHTGI
jgi:hypothetical protein